jgi:hypothetical protein
MPSHPLTTAAPTSPEFSVQEGFHMVGYSSSNFGGATARLEYGLPDAAGTGKRWIGYDATNAQFTSDSVSKPQWLPHGLYRWNLSTPGTAHVGRGFVSDT